MTKTAATPTPTFLNAAQAAERAGVNRRTITRWVASGRLVPAYEPDTRTGSRLFTPESVDAALASTD